MNNIQRCRRSESGYAAVWGRGECGQEAVKECQGGGHDQRQPGTQAGGHAGLPGTHHATRALTNLLSTKTFARRPKAQTFLL